MAVPMKISCIEKRTTSTVTRDTDCPQNLDEGIAEGNHHAKEHHQEYAQEPGYHLQDRQIFLCWQPWASPLFNCDGRPAKSKANISKMLLRVTIGGHWKSQKPDRISDDRSGIVTSNSPTVWGQRQQMKLIDQSGSILDG